MLTAAAAAAPDAAAAARRSPAKPIADSGYEVVGFLLREILNELVELVLTVAEQQRKLRRKAATAAVADDHDHDHDDYDLTASDIFEACRVYEFEPHRLVTSSAPQLASAMHKMPIIQTSGKKHPFFF